MMSPFYWSLINILMLSIMMVIIFVYLFKKENDYRREILNKIDNIISLLQEKKQQ